MSGRSASLLLLNSYGKDEEEEQVSESTTMEISSTTLEVTTTTTTTITSSFSLVGYDRDDEDEQISHTQENLGRAVINPPRTQPAEIATPPPPTPPQEEFNSTQDPPTPVHLSTSSLRGITLLSSPFKCDAFLQPEPLEPPKAELQEKVIRFFALKNEGKSINDIRNSKHYKNPDILEKLVQHCGIFEIGSNYPSPLFDPSAFQPGDYYDSIAIEQRKLEEKRPEDRTGNRNIEFTQAAPAATSAKATDDKKRSKWDSMDSAAAAASNKPPPQVTVVTGTAPTAPTATGATSTNAYAEYIRDRKKREAMENPKDTNKKAKK